jgi:hypothetical protein
MIVDENRAEQRLLDIDVVGDVAVSLLLHDSSYLSPCIDRTAGAGGESIDAPPRAQGAYRLAHS